MESQQTNDSESLSHHPPHQTVVRRIPTPTQLHGSVQLPLTMSEHTNVSNAVHCRTAAASPLYCTKQHCVNANTTLTSSHPHPINQHTVVQVPHRTSCGSALSAVSAASPLLIIIYRARLALINHAQKLVRTCPNMLMTSLGISPYYEI